MGRPTIPPTRRKQTVSITLTPEQCQLLRWMAANLEKSVSVMLGEMIEREARKMSKKLEKPLPDTTQEQMVYTANGQIEAVAAVRGLVGNSGRRKAAKKSS